MRVSGNTWAAIRSAAVVAAVLTAKPLEAQAPPDLPRLAVSVTAGAMRPLEAPVRDLYSRVFLPVTVEADFRLTRRFFVFASGQFLSQDGEVIFDLPPAPVEHLPLTLNTTSLRFGVGAWFPWGRWVLVAAGGTSHTFYKERWAAAEVPPATGTVVGFIGQGGAEYRLSKWISVVSRAEYSYVPLDETRELVPTFDLSGVSVSGGMLVRF